MLIGLHGQSRAGKDTVAARLVERHGFEQLVLADSIRAVLYDLNPWILAAGDDIPCRLASLVDDYGWDQVKKLAPESVQYMIRLGQSARNHISPYVWLKATLGNEDGMFDPERRIVVSDIRQPNEVEFILANDGDLWLITRPGTVDQGMDSLLKDVEWDARLHNDGTIEDLDAFVDTIMEQYR